MSEISKPGRTSSRLQFRIRSQAECCDFGVRITAQITLSAPTLVLCITLFAGQLAENQQFFPGQVTKRRRQITLWITLFGGWETRLVLDPECFCVMLVPLSFCGWLHFSSFKICKEPIKSGKSLDFFVFKNILYISGHFRTTTPIPE